MEISARTGKSDSDGKVVYIDGPRNKSARGKRAADKRIWNSEDRLRGIMDTVVDGIITIDENGIIDSFSPAAERIFGYAANEIIGRDIGMLMPESFRERHEKHFANYLRTDDPKALSAGREMKGQRKDGAVFPISFAVSEMRLDDMRLFTAVVSDITERKQAENELRAAKIEAENANHAKSQFLSSMSHELRTPLNSILGFAQLLESGQDPPPGEDQTEFCRQIMKAGNHLLTLINEVLDLSKIETGQDTPSMEVVDVAGIMRECVEIIESLAARHYIWVDDRVSQASMPPIRVDRTRFKQILINLLTNAVKYNEPGGNVTVIHDLSEEGKLRIGVRDTGPGIPESRVEELFLPFSRLVAEGGEIEGTGIGLTITKRLVEMMDGRIWVKSRPGEGSVFWVEFDLAKERRPENFPFPAEPPPMAAAFPAQRKIDRHVVLYIEDNPGNLLLMRKVMSRRPEFSLIEAGDAKHGLNLAHAWQPDVVVMDINLPGMDGFEALKELKESERTKDISVIALAANAMPKNIEKGKQAGFLDYLSKPVEIGPFMNALDRVVEGNV